jgi:putative oxidoreductase
MLRRSAGSVVHRDFMNSLPALIRGPARLFILGANLLQSPLLLALRLYFFWQLFQTGWGKLTHIGKIVDFFTSLHIPFPLYNAYLVGSVECFGGLLLIVGLGSRLVAIPIVISMLVAYITADSEALNSIFTDSDKFVQAAPFPYLLVGLIVLAFGSGLFSIDALIKRFVEPKQLAGEQS